MVFRRKTGRPSKPEGRAILRGVIGEIRENSRRYDANLRELKWALFFVGDDPAALLPDWDWEWPPWLRLLPVMHFAKDRMFCSPLFSQAVFIQRIQSLYALYDDQPTIISDLATTWSPQRNDLYTTIFSRLDERRLHVITLTREVGATLVKALDNLALLR
jgi:hypothetical protein